MAGAVANSLSFSTFPVLAHLPRVHDAAGACDRPNPLAGAWGPSQALGASRQHHPIRHIRPAGLSVPEAGAAVQQALAEGVEGAKEVAAKAAGAVGAAAEEVAGGPVGYPVDAAEVEGPVGPKEL